MDPINEIVIWGTDFVANNIDFLITVLIIDLVVGIIISVIGSYLWRRKYPDMVVYFRNKGDKYSNLIDFGSYLVMICIITTIIIVVILVFGDIYLKLGIK